MEYITEGMLPLDKKEARILRVKAPSFEVDNGILPLLRCVNGKEAEYLIREMHEGATRAHKGAHTITNKILSIWYYCPTMYQEAKVEPFPKAPGKVKFLELAIDYFTKGVNAEPLATITS
uniref:Integrase zinc-binding domain-containing protein n=1 Tax=Lactuca sativa TaxID=4236 RepID=A0A9R1XDE2_LACSA|nr:hypothetical protein LSAT_V11C400204620 [Lactuca sativa]